MRSVTFSEIWIWPLLIMVLDKKAFVWSEYVLLHNTLVQKDLLLLLHTYGCNPNVYLEASSQMMKNKQSPLNLFLKPAVFLR